MGKIQVIGGDGGLVVGSAGGGAGSGGRIAMFFADNKTYTGLFDAYGGLGHSVEGNGSPGTIYFYHTGQRILYMLVCIIHENWSSLIFRYDMI